uniref:Uncharacterized protein n=1 Tax=Arundo donax TaxID=35708 RepID=A0A0A8YD63_ARUDO
MRRMVGVYIRVLW